MGSLKSFLEYLNANEKVFKFTGQGDKKEMCFLDVRLCSDGHLINTNLYRKPLLGNTLLMTKSGHPKHTIKGIPIFMSMPNM